MFGIQRFFVLFCLFFVSCGKKNAALPVPEPCGGCIPPLVCDESEKTCKTPCGAGFCTAQQICSSQNECVTPCVPECEPPAVCAEDGVCRFFCSLYCDTGRCDEVTGRCLAPCEGIDCPGGFMCDDARGVCVSVCDGRICADGETCNPETGACEPQTAGPACTADQVPLPNVGITEPPGLDGCPPGMAFSAAASVCMDRWEAHLVLTGSPEQPWSPYFNPGSRTVRAVSAPGAVPQGYISGSHAAAACAAAGKRLCTRQEWESACRGVSLWTYPYGNARQPGVCNDARAVHPAVEYFGTSESWIYSELDHPCLNQLPDSLDRTQANPGCVTPEGFYDLMGNLHEWISDPDGTFKGGFYVDTVINGNGCLYTTTAHTFTYWDYSTGFRCCADR